MMGTSSLWIGDLTDYMDENFLTAACSALGEYGIRGVKVIRQKFTGKTMGYGFLQFADEATAMETLSRLQGKVIPNSNPPVRFKLNYGVFKKSSEREFSVWVGDIDKEVSEDELLRAFQARYASVRTARILRVPTGQSKGYGFVRFANEDEYKDALVTMNGYRGLGTRSIKCSPAIPRKDQAGEFGGDGSQAGATAASGTTPIDYSYYYDNQSYWNNATGWENYEAMADAYYGQSDQYRYDSSGQQYQASSGDYSAAQEETYDEYALVDHDVAVDLKQLDRDFLEKNNEFYDALSNSRWLPPDIADLYDQVALKDI